MDESLNGLYFDTEVRMVIIRFLKSMCGNVSGVEKVNNEIILAFQCQLIRVTISKMSAGYLNAACALVASLKNERTGARQSPLKNA